MRADPPPPIPLYTADPQAVDDLRFIRSTMERAGAFTALPGVGGMAMGCVALLAAAVAGADTGSPRWLAAWFAACGIAVLIGVIAVWRKTRADGRSLTHATTTRFASIFAPAIVAAALLTLAVMRAGAPHLLPGVWLTLYGAAFLAAGAVSVRVIPVMGACFLACGGVALLAPAAWSALVMAIGFGGLHIAFGAVIARRYGG